MPNPVGTRERPAALGCRTGRMDRSAIEIFRVLSGLLPGWRMPAGSWYTF